MIITQLGLVIKFLIKFPNISYNEFSTTIQILSLTRVSSTIMGIGDVSVTVSIKRVFFCDLVTRRIAVIDRIKMSD